MGKQLLRAIAIGAALALIFSAASFAKPHVIRAGILFLRDDGGISPSKLPKRIQTPVSAHIDATIGTTDGSHPPAVETLSIDFDKTIQVNAEGLPACRQGRLEALPTVAAEKACPEAIVGSGEGEVEVAFPEQRPFSAKGPVVLFNGGVRGGTTTLFVHAYVAVPAPTAVVVRVDLTRINRGHYGIHTFSEVPAIAGGAGSVIRFRLGINRRFTYRGEKRELPHRQLPDRDLLHRREHPVRRRHRAPGRPRPALHSKALALASHRQSPPSSRFYFYGTTKRELSGGRYRGPESGSIGADLRPRRQMPRKPLTPLVRSRLREQPVQSTADGGSLMAARKKASKKPAKKAKAKAAKKVKRVKAKATKTAKKAKRKVAKKTTRAKAKKTKVAKKVKAKAKKAKAKTKSKATKKRKAAKKTKTRAKAKPKAKAKAKKRRR